MPITTSTLYTKERLLNFNRRVALMKPIRCILWGLCTVFAVLYFFLSYRNAGTPSIFATVYLFFVLFWDLVTVFVYFVLPFFTVGKSPSLGAELQYFFAEDDFSVTAVTRLGQEHSTLRYAALVSAACYGDELYLMISKNQGYIVALEGLSIEHRAALRAILSRHLLPKKLRWPSDAA